VVAAGIDDQTVMAVSGHSSTRMLERYTHPTDERKTAVLESFSGVGVDTIWPQRKNERPQVKIRRTRKGPARAGRRRV
jgi:hypothetical protein